VYTTRFDEKGSFFASQQATRERLLRLVRSDVGETLATVLHKSAGWRKDNNPEDSSDDDRADDDSDEEQASTQ
jgi:hypothetical protein